MRLPQPLSILSRGHRLDCDRRTAIEDWFRRKGPQSPCTRAQLSSIDLFPNILARQLPEIALQVSTLARGGGCADDGWDSESEEENELVELTRDPITLQLMRDPVVAADGFTYERCSPSLIPPPASLPSSSSLPHTSLSVRETFAL